MDKVSVLGDKVLTLLLEGSDYFSLYESIKNITKNDIYEIIELFKNANYSIVEKEVK